MKTPAHRQPESPTAVKPIETPANVETTPSADGAERPATAPARSRLSGIERGGEIYDLYTGAASRAILGKLLAGNGAQAKELRQLVLQAIDAGFVKTNSVKIEAPSLRMLFTEMTPGLKFSTDQHPARLRRVVRVSLR